MTVTLVHEICHNFFGYFENKNLAEKLWNHITSVFSNEDLQTQMHLIVIPLTRAGLRQIYPEEKVNQLLQLEKKYEGLEKAWQILDKQPMKQESDPIEYILFLREIY